MNNKFLVSAAPHIQTGKSTARIMWTVNAALAPAGCVAVFVFGLASLWVILIAVLSAVAAEAFLQKSRRQKVTVSDGSAFLTGMLLAYSLPPGCPLWAAAAGSVFAITVGKQIFGGLGSNVFNPALAGRAFLAVSWPSAMTAFPPPFAARAVEAVTQATPLNMLKHGKAAGLLETGLNYWDLFLGNRPGSLGEVCVLALLAGGLFLLCQGIISWHIPVSFILTVGVLGGIFGGDILFSMFSGGLILGAVYMATDYVGSPVTSKGELVFGAGCGLLTAVMRRWSGSPEGVCYAILIMNAFTPIIDRYIQPRRYGYLMSNESFNDK